MEHSAGTYGVFNHSTRRWERGLSLVEASRREAEYSAPSNAVLLPGRMNTRKPGTDARYRNNREMAARGATLTAGAVN
jgi:hypothetical protein